MSTSGIVSFSVVVCHTTRILSPIAGVRFPYGLPFPTRHRAHSRARDFVLSPQSLHSSELLFYGTAVSRIKRTVVHTHSPEQFLRRSELSMVYLCISGSNKLSQDIIKPKSVPVHHAAGTGKWTISGNAWPISRCCNRWYSLSSPVRSPNRLRVYGDRTKMPVKVEHVSPEIRRRRSD